MTIKTLCYSPSRTSGDKKAKQNKIKSMSLLACFKRKSDMLHMVSVVGGREPGRAFCIQYVASATTQAPSPESLCNGCG